MLRLQVNDLKKRFAHRPAPTYTVRRNPQKKSRASTHKVRHVGRRTILMLNCSLTHLPDFDEPHDPFDSLPQKLWAQVPQLIRKDVEQHVEAHLPADILEKCATCTRAEFLSVLTQRSSILAAVWLSGTCAESNSLTASWKPTLSVAIGTTAISGCSPRSLRSQNVLRTCMGEGRGYSMAYNAQVGASSTSDAVRFLCFFRGSFARSATAREARA
jgi:hypothetical protein